MNREVESRFSMAPIDLNMGRSVFNIPYKHLTTCNAADLNCCYAIDVLPGDTFSLDMGAAIRMTTPIFPVMDNAFVDVWFYFVPNRLIWEHWKEFMGENNLTAWEQPNEYTIPQIAAPAGGWAVGTLADQLGLPIGVEGIETDAMPFRAYALIWNEWYRNQNTNDPVMVNLDDATVTGVNTWDDTNIVENGQLGALLKVAKTADYFTSALPEPQKGPAVAIPGVEFNSSIPVVGNGNMLGLYAVPNGQSDLSTMRWQYSSDGVSVRSQTTALEAGATGNSSGTQPAASNIIGVTPDPTLSGLIADTSDVTTTAVTINELRQAFAVQKFYERQALYGSRYIETIKAFFSVTSPDARLQRPEYLGGVRFNVNVDQVVQTSASQQQEGLTTTPQGNTAAYSLTNFAGNMFTHSFVEHGWLLGLYAIRQKHSYQQGIPRKFSRKDKFDYYWPVFANLGNQAILNKEIYAQGNTVKDSDGNVIDDKAFGYQEAWAEYRYMPDIISGKFRSNANGTLDAWHYGDDYDSLPMLSAEWMNETDQNIQRTLAVDNEPQFICDFYFRNTASRVMPLYSIPGLIDHH